MNDALENQAFIMIPVKKKNSLRSYPEILNVTDTEKTTKEDVPTLTMSSNKVLKHKIRN